MTAPVIDVAGVSFSRGGLTILQDVSLQVGAGEFIGVIGPNAGGKTTLLRLLLGLLQADQGRISLFGRPPAQGVRDVAYVPQHPGFDRNFPISVAEVVKLGAVNSRYAGDPRAVPETLRSLGLEALARRRINTLSGGQLQRLLIARCLVSRPRLLLLDEPTANVDVGAEESLFSLLTERMKDMTIVLVSHDISFISSYVSRVACLNRTLVCHDTENITSTLIKELYQEPIKYIRHEHRT